MPITPCCIGSHGYRSSTHPSSVKNITWKRTLRTPSSERFLALYHGKEAAAVDLHYLPQGNISGTVIVLQSSGLKESEIPTLLSSLDDEFLPAGAKNPITLKLIYLDQGTGNFSVRYDASADPDKTAINITKTNSGRWVEKSITIADAAFANKGPRNSDFSLVNEDDEDDVFHLIEITK
jgi:hypothetical protein